MKRIFNKRQAFLMLVASTAMSAFAIQSTRIEFSGPSIDPALINSGSPVQESDGEGQKGIALRRLQDIAQGHATSNTQRRDAQWTLGLLNVHGVALPMDAMAARQWFESAQKLGHPLAPAGLAWCEIDGCGQPANLPAARPWIGQLRKSDVPLSNYLEWLLMERMTPLQIATPRSSSGSQAAVGARAGDRARGGARAAALDSQQSLLSRAAKAGNPPALVEMGLADVAQGQLAAALSEFKAAAARSPAAAANVQLLSERMPGANNSNPSPSSSNIILNSGEPLSAQQMLAQAQRYHRGEGVPANYSEALRLYQLAANRGSAPARQMLQLIYSRPSIDGSLNIVWMQQLTRINPSDPANPLAQIGAVPSAQPYQRDITPLMYLVPAQWRN